MSDQRTTGPRRLPTIRTSRLLSVPAVHARTMRNRTERTTSPPSTDAARKASGTRSWEGCSSICCSARMNLFCTSPQLPASIVIDEPLAERPKCVRPHDGDLACSQPFTDFHGLTGFDGPGGFSQREGRGFGKEGQEGGKIQQG